MSELERAVPNTVYQQAVERPVPEHIIVSTLAANGRRDPDAIRDALEAAVECGDLDHEPIGLGELERYARVWLSAGSE